MLAEAGWQPPATGEHPTGRELIDEYLSPLAALEPMAARIRFGTRVTAVSRAGLDKVKTAGRGDAPFRRRTVGPDGEGDVLARAVIDASGTWSRPGPAGAAGVPALGERDVVDRISYRIPHISGPDRYRYANRRVLVVGSGHSAFNVLNDLAELRRDAPHTEIVWAVRRQELGQVFGGGENDALAERGRLGARIEELLASGEITIRLGAHLERFDLSADGRVTVISRARRSPRSTSSSWSPGSVLTRMCSRSSDSTSIRRSRRHRRWRRSSTPTSTPAGRSGRTVPTSSSTAMSRACTSSA